ncbi:MAG: phosphoglycerate mutase family protein [Alphaproteobacteria bacterium]|nr:phosphoglycerate mutase family protein [Alphaproteobacteria bacterium]
MRRLFVVRHGNTFAPGEPPRRVGARTDIPLVESGERQAAALGGWFADRGIRFQRILCGPLLRTRQTADAIAARIAAAPPREIADWLREVDHGPDENRTEAEVVARIGDAALRQWDERAVAPPGWIVDGPTRIAAWTALFDEPGDGDLLLVTSNGAARFALLALASGAAHAVGDGLKLRTGAIGEFRRTAAGWQVGFWDVRPGDSLS